MSERDSIYSLSVTPPPAARPWNFNAMSQSSGKLQTPNRNRTTDPSRNPFPGTSPNRDWTEQSRGFFEQYTSYGVAPTVPTTETPNRPSTAYGPPPTPTGQEQNTIEAEPEPTSVRRRRRHGKNAADYQADADLANGTLEKRDPDYNPSQEVAGPSYSASNKKRKASSPIPSPTEQTKKPKSGKPTKEINFRYHQRSAESKLHRDNCIAQIYENWDADPDRWLPESLIPRTKQREQLEPCDWNDPLLAELVKLSEVTKDQPRIAANAVKSAVTRQNREGRGPALLASDVRHARRMCQAGYYGEAAGAGDVIPSSSPIVDPDPEEDADENINVAQIVDEAPAHLSLDSSHDTQLPSPGPEPDPEPVHETEPEPAALITPVTPFLQQQRDETPAPWDDELARLQQQELEAELEVKSARLKLIQLKRRMHEQARSRQSI